ncbi:MAG: AAA family ATPase, partial [Planctomycetes bacterium]|nr:AAA family ATPase [Planctomycetota bacterium]
FVRFGSSPRGVQALILAGKVRAMLDRRYHVSFADIAQAVLPALRHRVLLNFEGQAEGILNDDILSEILKETPKAMDQDVNVP